MHLLGEFRENLRDFHTGNRRLNRLEFTSGRTARLGIPRIDMSHTAAIPEQNDVLCSRSVALAFEGQQIANLPTEQRRSGRTQHRSTGHLVVKTGHVTVPRRQISQYTNFNNISRKFDPHTLRMRLA